MAESKQILIYNVSYETNYGGLLAYIAVQTTCRFIDHLVSVVYGIQDKSFDMGARALCDPTTPTIIKKLRSKGIAMHAYGVSIYYA